MFPWVQVLRGLAAAMVVAVHYVATQGTSSSIGEWLHGVGGAGVDVFFVISGFIMSMTQSRAAGADAAGYFLARRLVRIAPLYWALTLAAFALSVVAQSVVHSHFPPRMFAMSMLFLPYSETPLLMSADAYKAYILPMAWTLTYEWYFYLAFAAALALKLRAVPRLQALGLWFGMSVLLGVLLRPEALLAQVVTSPLVFEFLAGCAIAALHGAGLRLSAAQAVLLAAIGLATLGGYTPASVWDRSLVWGGAACLLVSSAVLYERQRQSVPWRMLVECGDVSYSLYLSHFFTVALFVRLQAKAAFLRDGYAAITILAFVLLCMAVAEACYRLIEHPARSFFAGRMKRAVPA